MKKKRLLSLIAALMLVVMTFTACGGSGGEESEAPKEDTGAELSMADDVAAYAKAMDMEYAYDLAEELAYNMDLADNELGWRSAGSDAEHATADYLAEEMEKIGLTEVEKVGTPVDKFQFNDSSLTIEGTKIDLMPAAYQCSGTNEEGITAEIVNAKTGAEFDYAKMDSVEGKIVLVQVDQANVSWIDGYIRAAHEQGAAAIVTYANSGYGEVSNDSINVQDICCEDLIPTVAISYNEAKKIKKAIKNGNNQATLMVDVEFVPDGGTTYNVVGKIKGKSSDQQIMLSSHYDKYWYGFQDNCTAVSLTFTVAKAMIDSGYVPENDIVVVAHGAEEWGATDSQFDWTTGAWGMIEKNPDWAEKTICMLNTELPGYKTKTGEININAVPEYQALANKLVADSGLVESYGDCTLLAEAVDVANMEDGVSYRWHGVPYMLNGTFLGGGDNFGSERYHTHFDDKDTWDEDTMKTNVHWYGAFSIYMDKMPAMELDMTATCDDLLDNLGDKIAKKAGVDVEAYKAEVETLREAAQAHNDKIAEVNAAYEEAVAAEDEAKIAELREEGAALNQISLKAFKEVQDQFLKADDVDVYIGHDPVNANIKYLKGAIKQLDKKVLWGEDGDGALDIIFNLNAYHDWAYYFFGKEVGYDVVTQYDEDYTDRSKLFWGTDKLYPVIYVADTSYDLSMADANGEKPDYEAAKAVYQEALDAAYADVKAYCEEEVAGMKTIAAILQQ